MKLTISSACNCLMYKKSSFWMWQKGSTIQSISKLKIDIRCWHTKIRLLVYHFGQKRLHFYFPTTTSFYYLFNGCEVNPEKYWPRWVQAGLRLTDQMKVNPLQPELTQANILHRVPTFLDWQNSLTFPVFLPFFQYFFNVLFFLTENLIHFTKKCTVHLNIPKNIK